MVTGELKNKIDSLWDIFAAGGLVNPLDVIEQITYLMFIRDLDDSDNLRAAYNKLRSTFGNNTGREYYQLVKQIAEARQ